RLAHGRLEQAFIGFEVAGRLVEHQPAVRLLFDHQQAAVALDHGGHGHVRLPEPALAVAHVWDPSPARSANAHFAAPEPPPSIRGAAPPGPGAYNRTHAEPAARSPARPRPRPWRRGRSRPAEA